MGQVEPLTLKITNTTKSCEQINSKEKAKLCAETSQGVLQLRCEDGIYILTILCQTFSLSAFMGSLREGDSENGEITSHSRLTIFHCGA